MSVLFSAEISCVENLDSSNLQHEHGGPQNMSCVVAPELDSSHLLLLMEVDGFNLVHRSLKITLCKQHLVCGNIAHLNQEDFV